MRATFYSFDTMRKALNASQMALDITGQNISNVNTEGYSRQRVDLTAISSENGNYKYASINTSRVGQGVDVAGISQVRDQFLDARFRKENSQFSEYDTKVFALTDIENILDETTVDGLQARFGHFILQLNEYSKNPESVEFASIFRTSAQKVTEILNQYSNMLNEVRDQQINDLNISISDVNGIIQKIVDLNSQIKSEKIQGNPSNELLDSRNLLLDKLSKYTGFNVENQVDGTIAIKIGDSYMIDSNNVKLLITLDLSSAVDVKWSDGTVFDTNKGSIKANLDILNGKGLYATGIENTSKGIPYYMESLDNLSVLFADTINTLNNDGTAKNLFAANDGSSDITAANITISPEWIANVKYVTTTTRVPYEEGNNDNLLRMIDALQKDFNITSDFKGTFEEYIVSLSSDIAIDMDYYSDMQESSYYIVTTISNQRDSIMGVSLDEEGINMMKFQKSYNAAARLMTVLDEALDTIINKMGITGR